MPADTGEPEAEGLPPCAVWSQPPGLTTRRDKAQGTQRPLCPGLLGCAWLGALIADPKVLKSKRVVSSQVTKDERKSST